MAITVAQDEPVLNEYITYRVYTTPTEYININCELHLFLVGRELRSSFECPLFRMLFPSGVALFMHRDDGTFMREPNALREGLEMETPAPSPWV